jgi:hypothetical protein
MCQAINKALVILETWVQQNQASFPPTVINITDGEATDGEPTIPANSLKSLSTSDGNLLLFNVHVSSSNSNPIEYPSSDLQLPDQYAKLLFQMSSLLPPHMQDIAKQEGLQISENSRGFAFNADLVSLIKFLDIGTRPSNLR